MRIYDLDVETDGLQPYRGHRPFLVQAWEGDGTNWPELEEVALYPLPEARAEVQALLDDIAEEHAQGDEVYLRAHSSKFDFAMLEQDGFTLPPEETWLDNLVVCRLGDERVTAALKRRHELLFGPDVHNHEKDVKDWLATETRRRQKEHKGQIYDWLEQQGFPQKRNRLPQVPAGLDLPDGLRYEPPTYKDVPWEIMKFYAADDIVKTARTGAWYANKLPEGVGKVNELEQGAGVLGTLYSIEKRGIPIDRTSAQAALVRSSQALDHHTKRAKDLAGRGNFNPDSPDQVHKVLAGLGADLSFAPKTPAKNVSMGEETLETVAGLVDNTAAAEFAQAVLDFRAEAKMFGTYLLPMLQRTAYSNGAPRESFIGEDDRIHTSYHQMGARTGRTSSSDPNVQNWHRDDLRLRYLVQAPPGKKLVTVDMDSIEARVMALYVGPGAWRDAVEAGNIHMNTADMVGLTGRQRASGFESPRQQGKRFNYLVMFGGGKRAIKRFLLVSQAQAAEALDRFYTAYPEVQAFAYDIEDRLAERGYIHTLYGRRMRLDGPTRKVPNPLRAYGYKFVNYLIQGTAADLIKIAMVRLHAEGCPLVALYHDELLAECDEDEAEHWQGRMEAALTDFPEFTKHVSMGADGAVVDRWSEAKDPDYVPPYLDTADTVVA